MNVFIALLEHQVVRAAMRVHNYRERYTELRRITKGGELNRFADDATWDKLDSLETERDAACARLAKARKDG